MMSGGSVPEIPEGLVIFTELPNPKWSFANAKIRMNYIDEDKGSVWYCHGELEHFDVRYRLLLDMMTLRALARKLAKIVDTPEFHNFSRNVQQWNYVS